VFGAGGSVMAGKTGATHYVTGSFTYSIEGLDDLNRMLQQLPKQFRRTVLTKALTKAAQPTLELARANAPDSGVEHKSKLRDTMHIATRLNKNQRRGRGRLVDGAEIFIGSNAPHAHLVEFGTAERTRKKIGGLFSWVKNPKSLGTGHMPRRPFLTQSWDSTKMQALEILKKELWKEMVAAVRRLRNRAAKGTLSIKTLREMM
jgi:HK97 gp10 family phage protein